MFGVEKKLVEKWKDATGFWELKATSGAKTIGGLEDVSFISLKSSINRFGDNT